MGAVRGFSQHSPHDAQRRGGCVKLVLSAEVSGGVRAEELANEPEIRPYALVLSDGTCLTAAS
jgi:hypothetical protein